MGAKSRGNWNLPFCLKVECVHHGSADCTWCRKYSMLKLKEAEDGVQGEKVEEGQEEAELSEASEVNHADDGSADS